MSALKGMWKKILILMLIWALIKSVYSRYLGQKILEEVATSGAPLVLKNIEVSLALSSLGWVISLLGYAILFYLGFQAAKEYQKIKDSALVGVVASIIGVLGMFIFPAILNKIWILPESVATAQNMINTIRQQMPGIYTFATIIGAMAWIWSIGIDVVVACLGGYISKRKNKW